MLVTIVRSKARREDQVRDPNTVTINHIMADSSNSVTTHMTNNVSLNAHCFCVTKVSHQSQYRSMPYINFFIKYSG
jgi:hypothetical protein